MKRIVKQPDVRRQELLNIGVKLYFEAGEKGISIQQVVKQANVATGLFYYYFKSKDEFLNEALNNYIREEVQAFEIILEDRTLTACEKMDAVFDAYFKYAKKMAPLRSITAFHTERHYALTEKLIAQLKDKVGKVLLQGLAENVFETGDVSITAGFILNGLTSVFDANTNMSDASLAEVKRLVNKILKGS